MAIERKNFDKSTRKRGTTMNVFEVLKERGFVYQTSNENGVRKLLSQPGATLYQGFDPSADSLHLGHLMSLIAMHFLQEAGHKVIFILGGGTGRVGDPEGKSKSRIMLTFEQVAENGKKLKKQVEAMGLVRFSGENKALMIDNYQWLGRFSFLEDFMVGIAKVFSVNEMIKMKTFAERLESKQNLSLMEFCYPVMQAWDFLELFRRYDCKIQMGGQDQWTNILQGKELIHKAEGKEAFGFTFPLLTTPSGVKMGKTEKGPVWLDAKKTSSFDLYQHLVKTPDDLLSQMLKLFTFLPLNEIKKVLKNPQTAQRVLAFEVTKIVHGEGEAERARKDSEKLFGKEEGTAKGIPVFEVAEEGESLDEILIESRSLPSKAEVRRRCGAGAIKFNETKISNSKFVIKETGIIRFGKSSFLRIEIK